MDQQLLEQQISGMKGQISSLQANRDNFLKLQGIDEETAKARDELAELEVDHQALKEQIADLQSSKALKLGELTGEITARMDKVIASGCSVFEIGEAGIFIGAQKSDGARIPYFALSGGQKVLFQQALIYALLGKGPKCLVVEAAELDQQNLDQLIEVLERLPEEVQSIVMTCHGPAAYPAKNWQIVEVKS